MENYQTIEIIRESKFATIWLNRPELHNAFNVIMIKEITKAFTRLEEEDDIRLIIIRGRGRSFCSGADINWMRESAGYSREENYREALQLSECFFRIYSCSKPVITCAHGASTGGANGFVAASDISLCDNDTLFSLSEVKIGLVPAVISPYVIKRLGEFASRELMLTAGRFYGAEAARLGLVNHSYKADELEQELGRLIGQLLEAGPEALARSKKLIFDVCNELNVCNAVGKTAGLIADIRVSEEAQEGMSAFIEKRKPSWITN